MSHVYPRAPEVAPAITPVTDAALALRIISEREDDEELTKEKAVGLILRGEGTVVQFNRVWDEVEAERAAWSVVSPANYDNVTKFKDALTGKHLDPTTWYDGLKAEHDVTSYADLKAKFTIVEP